MYTPTHMCVTGKDQFAIFKVVKLNFLKTFNCVCKISINNNYVKRQINKLSYDDE